MFHDFLDCLPEDCGVAHLKFSYEGILRGWILCPDCFLPGYGVENGYTQDYSNDAKGIANCTCHGHPVCTRHVRGVNLQMSLLGGSQHRGVGCGTG